MDRGSPDGVGGGGESWGGVWVDSARSLGEFVAGVVTVVGRALSEFITGMNGVRSRGWGGLSVPRVGGGLVAGSAHGGLAAGLGLDIIEAALEGIDPGVVEELDIDGLSESSDGCNNECLSHNFSVNAGFSKYYYDGLFLSLKVLSSDRFRF